MQALADYAELIVALEDKLSSPDSAVIGFGGSYGEPCHEAAAALLCFSVLPDCEVKGRIERGVSCESFR